MTVWWLCDDCVMTVWWLSDHGCLMTSWWLACDFLVTSWWLPDDFLVTSWWLPGGFMMTAWWLSDDCLILPDDCLMTVRWLSDDWYWLKLKIRFIKHSNSISYTVFLQKDQTYDVLRHQLPQNWKPEPDSTNTSATSSTGNLFLD